MVLPSYLDFENNFCLFNRYGINTIDTDICIPNNIFDRIGSLEFTTKTHLCFLFSSYALLLLTNSFSDKHIALNIANADNERRNRLIEKNKQFCYYPPDGNIKNMCVSNEQLRTMWGYAFNNKNLNYLTKQNGIMDKAGLTEFFIKGYKHISYRADRAKGNYFRVPIDVMLYCTMINDLKDFAFTIYSVISRASQTQSKDRIVLSRYYIKDVIGIDISTISKYVSMLEKYNLLNVGRTWVVNNPQNKANCYTLIKELNDRHFSDYNSFFS